ncbi:hypothetical protein J7K18_05195 [bacterium]|nr:hypothetical protein [bacterium]
MKKILNIILILIFFAFLYNLVDMMFKRQKEGGLKEITVAGNILEQLKKESANPTLLLFGEKGNDETEKMIKILKELKLDYGSRLNINFVDLEKNQNVKKKYNIIRVPTLYVITTQGQVAHRIVGVVQKERLRFLLKEAGLRKKWNPLE